MIVDFARASHVIVVRGITVSNYPQLLAHRQGMRRSYVSYSDGGTTSITTRRTPAENKASNLDHQWPQDWGNDGREPEANLPVTGQVPVIGSAITLRRASRAGLR
jgi:hypothetical protein